MIHNVDSYTTNVTSQEHNLSNCVHKHSGNWLDTDVDIKASKQAAQTQPAEQKMSIFDYVTGNIKKILGNGFGLLRGIWNEAGEQGSQEEVTGVLQGEEQNNGQQKVETSAVANTMAMESVADIRIPKKTEATAEEDSWKLSGAIPSLKVKTGQARERFEARKDAFLKRMKEMAKSRKKHSFEESKEERPGQQEKEMEWFGMENSHLLDSYNKNGEYASLGNRIEGQGYSGSPVKENYSKKA